MNRRVAERRLLYFEIGWRFRILLFLSRADVSLLKEPVSWRVSCEKYLSLPSTGSRSVRSLIVAGYVSEAGYAAPLCSGFLHIYLES